METKSKNQQSGFGITGMILGILAVLSSAIFIGGALGIMAIVFSTIGMTRKQRGHGTAIAGLVMGIVAIVIVIGIFSENETPDSESGGNSKNTEISSVKDSDGGKNNDAINSTLEDKQENSEYSSTQESNRDEDEFKNSCKEFNYKQIARNPDDYKGQNFVVDVKVSQSINGKWYSKYDTYYKVYTNDEYDWWMGDFLYIIDMRDKKSEDYTRILEDDIIRVYGTFNGLTETKNSLTGSKSDDVSLDMYYCELLEE